MLWLASGSAAWSAVLVLLVGWFLALRARVLIHRYATRNDGSVLPLLNSPESDIAYSIQKTNRQTQRNQAHLTEQLDQINTALQSVDRGFVLLGAQNQLRWFNLGAERYLGLSKADLGKPLDHFLRDPAFGPIMVPIETDQIVVATSPLDTERTYEYNAFPEGENGKVLIVRDITRLRQLEKTRSDFASNLSHELKTPLTVVKGYAESIHEILEDDQAPDSVIKGIRQIKNQADRMQEIVEDLLWLNRLESTQLVDSADLNLGQILEQVRQEALELASTLGRRPNITINAVTEGVNGNHREILTAMRNLCFNAIRYSQENVEIDLVWRVSTSRAELMVKDNGPGIPRHLIRRITERFFRVDSARSRDDGGTGLGLSIVKHVAERHGGKLRIRSLVGKGSEFICQFPLERVVEIKRPLLDESESIDS